MDPRERKGIEIAGQKPIFFQNGRWVVPSQSKPGKTYRVNFRPESQDCSCPDFELIEPVWCKHIYAVRYVMNERGLLPKPTPRSPRAKKYPRDWPVYNEAKANELPKFRRLLFDLCCGLPTPPPGRQGGRPRVPLADLVYAAVTKVYVREAGRKLNGHLEQTQEAGYISQVPKASTVLIFFSGPESADILRALIEQSSRPLTEIETSFPVDSTSFKLPRFRRSFDEDAGQAVEKREWVKAHLVCGLKTHVVASVIVTPSNQHDGPVFPHLLHQTSQRFRVLEVMADAAYASGENFGAADDIGAIPVIAFSKQATGHIGGVFQKMFHIYRFDRDEFRKRYNLRNNAESTASMLKRRFGDMLTFRTDPAIENEVLARVLVHNICCVIQSSFELGIDAEFWGEGALA